MAVADARITRSLTWPDPSDQPAVISEQVLAALLDAVEKVPATTTGGMDGILETLLSAKTIDDLNRPWNGTSGRDLAGKRLRINSIIRRPSQFEDGPQLFLVCDAVDAKTGEKVTMTSSALAVILQLAVAYNAGMFPILCDVIVAERPTARGYYPYHLLILATSQTAGTAGG